VGIEIYKTVPLPLFCVGVKLCHFKGRTQIQCVRNVVLRRILGPTTDEVKKGWSKLHNDKFHNLYSLPCIIRMIKSRKMRWAAYVACIFRLRNACTIFVGTSEGKRALGRLCCRLNSVRMDIMRV
jgi:hypothetical protein